MYGDFPYIHVIFTLQWLFVLVLVCIQTQDYVCSSYNYGDVGLNPRLKVRKSMNCGEQWTLTTKLERVGAVDSCEHF